MSSTAPASVAGAPDMLQPSWDVKTVSAPAGTPIARAKIEAARTKTGLFMEGAHARRRFWGWSTAAFDLCLPFAEGPGCRYERGVTFKKTLFVNPPSWQGFDGGAGAR